MKYVKYLSNTLSLSKAPWTRPQHIFSTVSASLFGVVAAVGLFSERMISKENLHINAAASATSLKVQGLATALDRSSKLSCMLKIQSIFYVKNLKHPHILTTTIVHHLNAHNIISITIIIWVLTVLQLKGPHISHYNYLIFSLS